ncbi:hypothetical protein Avbf_14949, partial [Armadillidium vulgare]
SWQLTTTNISFKINDFVNLSGFHDIIKKNSEISPTQRILNSLYLMTTLKNISSYWICKFTLLDFGIETNKLNINRYLAVTMLDETTILRSIFKEIQKFTL